MPGVVVYRGPSEYDGKPIVMLATWETTNRKTGDVVQTWILGADKSPQTLVNEGGDDSICGDCPQRHALGGSCYVLPFQGPRVVWEAWKRGSYSHDLGELEDALQGRKLRMGAYGDPAMVPSYIWESLAICSPLGWLGYTHQWRKPFAQNLRTYCMASVDTQSEESEALAMGWRTFRSRFADEPITARTIECLSDSRGMTCADCGICDGARENRPLQPASVWIQTHGARANRKHLPVIRTA